mgnify:CR=1 FL=1
MLFENLLQVQALMPVMAQFQCVRTDLITQAKLYNTLIEQFYDSTKDTFNPLLDTLLSQNDKQFIKSSYLGIRLLLDESKTSDAVFGDTLKNL